VAPQAMVQGGEIVVPLLSHGLDVACASGWRLLFLTPSENLTSDGESFRTGAARKWVWFCATEGASFAHSRLFVGNPSYA
jgi:hypothetical protein